MRFNFDCHYICILGSDMQRSLTRIFPSGTKLEKPERHSPNINLPPQQTVTTSNSHRNETSRLSAVQGLRM